MQMTEFLDRLENIFMNFRFADVLDVLLVAIVIYNAIKLIRETRAGQLVKGIIIVIGIWILANVAQLYMTQTLLTYVIQYGLVCVFVLFQPELRSALEKKWGAAASAAVCVPFLTRTAARRRRGRIGCAVVFWLWWRRATGCPEVKPAR